MDPAVESRCPGALQRGDHRGLPLRPARDCLRDERDAVLGGAIGHVWGGWLDLSLLWVTEPLRGKGYGKKLLEDAEDEARSQSCRGVFLNSFSFQAHPFYERLGYEVVGELSDYPPGHAYYFMRKMPV